MSSFTIAYLNPPCGSQDLLNNTAPAYIGAQNNNFSVSQSMAGLSSSGLVSSSAGLTVSAGAVSLPSASVQDSALSANVPLKNALNTFSAVNTFSSAPVMSGASISANSIPALSIVNDSLGDAQISAGGVGQSSVASGYLDLVNAQTVAGIKTFSSAPLMSGAGLSALSVPDSALSANVPLKNALNTFSAVNTFSSPPVLSGASISANSIPALSIVNDSLGDAQIATGGVGQTSVASGYVDLSNAQTVAGAKSFTSALTVSGAIATFNGGISTSTFSASGSASFNTVQASANISTQANLVVNGFANINGAGGLTVANGSSTLQNVNCTDLTVSGAITGTSSKVVITTDNTNGSYPLTFTKLANSNLLFCDDTVAPLLNYNPSTGALSTAVLSVSGTSTLNNIVLPVAQTALTITANTIALNLNSLSYNEFILPSANFTANITAITFQNVIVNSKFNIYIQGGAANRTINKNISSGPVTQLNNLAGNTQIGAGTTWRCEGTVVSATLVTLQFTNFT